MKIPKEIIALLGTVLCVALSGCGGGENPAEGPETEQEETTTEQMVSGQEETISGQEVSSELSGAYQQMAMYIQEGFRTYHVEGEYQAYFGPIEGGAPGVWVDGCYVGIWDETDRNYFTCDILLEGESGQWREEMAFTYDAEADWYIFSSQYEPLLAGVSLWREWGDSYATKVLDNCVCQTTVARDADIAAPIRYDSESGPMERNLYLVPSWHFRGKEDNGLAYQITPRAYYYWDDRLDVNIYILYPQVKLEEGQEEMEEAVNEKLQEAFFYGYGWQDDNVLAPGEEMYTNIKREYMITREDERYLSMRIYEYNSFRMGRLNEWETAITFDMRTGDVVRLGDVLGRDETGDAYTLGDLLDSGAFRKLWVWLPEDKDWIEELKEEKGDELLSEYETDFYLTDTGLGLITSLYEDFTCLEADFEDLGIKGF